MVTSQILAITNEANLTNYSFQLQIENAPVYEGEVSFFNLIVKETTAQVGYYAYIQEYRMDENWYNISEQDFDFGTYVGKIIIYTIEGLFVFSVEVNEGDFNRAHYKSPCPPNTGGGSGSGGSSNPPGGGSTGGTGGTGGGGPIVTIDYICGCEPGHIGGNSNPNCDCPLANIPIGIIISERTIEGIILNELRNPCPPLIDLPPDCNQPNGEPCLFGCNTDGSCIDENPNVGINLFKPHPHCQELLKISNHNLTRDKINQLKNELNAGIEKGFEIEMQNGEISNSTAIRDGEFNEFNYNFETLNPVIGIHLHHDKLYPMPTHEDVLTLFDLFGNSQNNSSIPTHIVVNSTGVHALKINNPTKLATLFVQAATDQEFYNDLMRNMEDAYRLINPVVNGLPTGSMTSNEKALLQLIEQYDMGIDLYRANTDVSGWVKLAVNEYNAVIESFECNN